MRKNIAIYVFLIFMPLLVFWQFFVKGLIPYPGNYQLAWYEPWKSDYFINGTINIPHKPIAEDAFKQIFPFTALYIEVLKNFKPPLWNPFNGSGMPLLAIINLGFLDPHNLLYLFLPPPFGWSFNVILQAVWLVIFAYLFFKQLSLSKEASFFGSIVLFFSGVVISRSLYICYTNSLTYLIVLLLIAEKYLKNQKTKFALFIPLLIFLIFVSTQPQISLYNLVFFLIYFIFRIFSEKKPKKILIYPLLLSLLGLFLGFVQLLPSYILYKNSNMTAFSSAFIFERFLLPLKHLITIAVPNYFGNPSTYNFWGPGTDFVETVAYVGIIPLFFAVICFFAKNKYSPLRNFFAIILILSLITVINSPLSKLIALTKIPLLSTGNPARIFLITTFCIAALAAFGFEYLKNNRLKKKEILLLFVLFLSFFIILICYTLFIKQTEPACISGVIPNCRQIALRNTLIELIAFFGLVVSVSFFAFKRKVIFLFFPVLVFIVIGFYNSQKLLPFSSPDTFYPKNDLITAIKKNVKINDRVFGLGEGNISANFATYFKFNDPNYYHPLYIKRYGELVSYANEKPLLRSDVEINKDLNLSTTLKQKRERLFNLLAVDYLIYKKSEINNKEDDHIVIWQNDKWVLLKIRDSSRVRLVNNYTVLNNDREILDLLFKKNFNPDKEAVFEEKTEYKNNEGNLGAVKIIEDTYTKVYIEVNSKGRSLLILSDNYYPGWKAFINNRETKIYRANYGFKGIIVPDGKNKVTFVYDPWFFRLGLSVSLFSLFIYLILIGKAVFKKVP